MTGITLTFLLWVMGAFAVYTLLESGKAAARAFTRLSNATSRHESGGAWVSFRILSKDCAPFVLNGKILPQAKIIHFPARGAGAASERKNAA